ncbi:MAG: hypothetical protein AAF843_16805 [Bacteroidota bacterium]
MSNKVVFSKKETVFLEKWTERRKKKTRFILKWGLPWGFTCAIFTYYWSIDFQFRETDEQLFFRLGFWSLVGILFSYWQYKGQENRWKIYNEQKKISLSSQK